MQIQLWKSSSSGDVLGFFPDPKVRSGQAWGGGGVGHDLQAVGGGQVMWGLVRSLDFLPSTVESHLKVRRKSVKPEISLAMRQGAVFHGKQSTDSLVTVQP